MATVLGLHGGYSVQQHDAAAVLIRDGVVVAAIEEERLYRQKGANGLLPIEATAACLVEAGIGLDEVDLIVMPGSTYEDAIPRAHSWLRHHFGTHPEVITINHQEAHLHSSFWQSPFERSLCVSFDAYGDRLSGAIATGSRREGIKVLETRPHDNSLGVFYGTMTSFLGFKPGEDEFKVMGLAAYGDEVLDLGFFLRTSKDGYYCDPSFARDEVRASQFEPHYSERLVDRLGAPRLRGEPLNERHIILARSTQQALETSIQSLIRYAISEFGTDEEIATNMCLSGGVALNCSANGSLLGSGAIKNLFVAPAASDRGLALGCAFAGANALNDVIQAPNSQFLGPSVSAARIEQALQLSGIRHRSLEDPAEVASSLIAQGKVVGWFQGRSEYGPRALGARSVLANPCDPEMKDRINAKIKFREEFRPFAPAVTEEASGTYFQMYEHSSPAMTVAFPTSDASVREILPATTHVNDTARVQTVSAEISPDLHRLLLFLQRETGHPVALNTSFNIKGQPIVESALEALSTFASTGMDALVIGPFLVEKP